MILESPAPVRAWLRLVRVPLAPTAAWDGVACLALALAFASDGRGLGSVELSSWALLALTSLLLYAAGMLANDLADRNRDRVLAPDRPLPSGAIRTRSATLVLAIVAAAAVVIGGGPAGSRTMVLTALGLAAVYDFAAKRWLIAGSLSMGAVRFANASVGVVPLVELGIAPPIALLGPAAVGIYGAAVTVLSTTEETPSMRRRVVMRLLAIVAFLLAGVLPWIAVGHPTLGVFVAFGAVTSITFVRTPRPGPPKRQVLEMLLGLYFLSMCLATAADGGTLAVNLAALGVALFLIWASQMMVRALK